MSYCDYSALIHKSEHELYAALGAPVFFRSNTENVLIDQKNFKKPAKMEKYLLFFQEDRHAVIFVVLSFDNVKNEYIVSSINVAPKS